MVELLDFVSKLKEQQSTKQIILGTLNEINARV